VKPWYRSKTIIVNALVAALVALEAVSGLLQPHLPLNFYTAIAVGLPVINAVLRVITSEGLRA
jgi:hypothetical protein